MAKALLGHVGTTPDFRLTMELRRLQLRVKELEARLADVESPAEESDREELLTIPEPAPALT